MTNFEQELTDLTEFFKIAKLPQEPFQLNKYMTLYDVTGFIQAEIQRIEKYQGNENVIAYSFTHLRELKELIEKDVLR